MSANENFKAGAIVWSKCGSHFWPGTILDFNSLDEEIREDFPEGKEPLFVVKFFDEDGYEFLKNDKNLYPYNCEKKEEFIKKGVVKNRAEVKAGAKNSWFAKFPQDIVRCEKLTNGDEKILEKDPYVERKEEKVDYKAIFGDSNEKLTPAGAKRKAEATLKSGASPKKKVKEAAVTPSRPISHPRFKPGGEQHNVRILEQPTSSMHLDLQKKEESKAASANSGMKCSLCDFTATRINVLIMHTKTHSEASKQKSLVSKPSKEINMTPGKVRGPTTPVKSRATPTTKKGTPADKKATPKTSKVVYFRIKSFKKWQSKPPKIR